MLKGFSQLQRSSPVNITAIPPGTVLQELEDVGSRADLVYCQVERSVAGKGGGGGGRADRIVEELGAIVSGIGSETGMGGCKESINYLISVGRTVEQEAVMKGIETVWSTMKWIGPATNKKGYHFGFLLSKHSEMQE